MKVFEAPPQTRDAILRKYGEVFVGANMVDDPQGTWDALMEAAASKGQEQYDSLLDETLQELPWWMHQRIRNLLEINREMVAGRIDEGVCEWLCYQSEPLDSFTIQYRQDDSLLIWPEDKDRALETFNWYFEKRKQSDVQNMIRQMFPGRSVKNPLEFSIYDLEDVQDALTPVAVQQAKNDRWKPEQRGILETEAETVFEDDGWLIVKCLDAKVAASYASGTRWCTSNKGTAQSYLNSGPLYVLFRNGQKYGQIHGESNQIMDVRDRPIQDLDPVVASFMARTELDRLIGSWKAFESEEVLVERLIQEEKVGVRAQIASLEQEISRIKVQFDGMDTGSNPLTRDIFGRIFPGFNTVKLDRYEADLTRLQETLADLDDPDGLFRSGGDGQSPLERKLEVARGEIRDNIYNMVSSVHNLFSRVQGDSMDRLRLPPETIPTIRSIMTSDDLEWPSNDYRLRNTIDSFASLISTVRNTRYWESTREDFFDWLARATSGSSRWSDLFFNYCVRFNYVPRVLGEPNADNPNLFDKSWDAVQSWLSNTYGRNGQLEGPDRYNQPTLLQTWNWLPLYAKAAPLLDHNGYLDPRQILWGLMSNDEDFASSFLEWILRDAESENPSQEARDMIEEIRVHFAEEVSLEELWKKDPPVFRGDMERYSEELRDFRRFADAVYGSEAVTAHIAAQTSEEADNDDELAAAFADVIVDEDGFPNDLGRIISDRLSLPSYYMHRVSEMGTLIVDCLPPAQKYLGSVSLGGENVAIPDDRLPIGVLVHRGWYRNESLQYRVGVNNPVELLVYVPGSYPDLSLGSYELVTDPDLYKAMVDDKTRVETPRFTIYLKDAVSSFINLDVLPNLVEERTFKQINSKGTGARPPARYGWMCMFCAERIEWDAEEGHWVADNEELDPSKFGANLDSSLRRQLLMNQDTPSVFAGDCRGFRRSYGQAVENGIYGTPLADDQWAPHGLKSGSPEVLWCEDCNGARAVSDNMGGNMYWSTARAIRPCKCGFTKANLQRNAEEGPTEAEITEEIVGSLGQGGPVGLGAEFDAEYVPIPENDMQTFMESLGFERANVPRSREVVYERIYGRGPEGGELKIRIYSSITGGRAREAGKDAIRVVPIYEHPTLGEFPMAKLKRVHRVTGWRRNLLRRIDSAEDGTPGPVLDSNGKPMRLRRNGRTGDHFWGSVDYPTNTETRPYRGG